MKKDKILIIIICILAVVVLVLASLLLFKGKDYNSSKKDNPTPNNNSLETVETVDTSIFSVVTDSYKKIYALTDDGNKIELFDASEYNGVVYTYYNGKLYLYLHKYTPQDDTNTGNSYNALGYIDLNDNNYSFTKLSDIMAQGYPSSIAVVNNIIYYSSSAFDGIYKYNIDTQSSSISNDFDFDGKIGIKLYTISDGKLAYSTAGRTNEPPTVGIIDIKSNTRREISSNATFEYVYDGNIIYSQYDAVNNYSKWKYYEYNVSSESNKQISDSTSLYHQSIDLSFIMPFDNYYIYVNGNGLYKFENNNSQKLYEFNGGIYSINLISSKLLNVVYEVVKNPTMYGVFDLNELKFNDTQDHNSYSQVIYLP